MNERTHVDLFTGIGGFSLAARANGVRTIAMCESDPRCQAFLAQAWTGVPVWPDVRSFGMANSPRIHARTGRSKRSEARIESADSLENVWLLTAGVPCQPASRAGKQRGQEDDRWLWPAAIKVFAAIRPAWGLFENPPGIGDVGLAGILSDLGREGYAVRVFSLGACALGAPHRRMRYWIVSKRVGLADSCQPRREGPDAEPGAERLHSEYPQGEQCGMANRQGFDAERAKPSGDGCWQSEGSTGNGTENQWSRYVWLPCADGKVRRAPDDSFSLVDGLHRSVLGALGNSIVPQVAAQIIAAMIQSESP